MFMPSEFGWFFGFGIIWMIVFWAAIIALIIWIVKKLTSKSGTASSSGALDIAKERYARGEITKEEFEQIKRDLS